MFSGKTTALEEFVRKMQKDDPKSVIVFQPSTNVRYGGKLVNHDEYLQGISSGIDVIGVNNEKPNLSALVGPLIKWVAIDEANFFPADVLAHEVQSLLQGGMNVFVVGLIYDFKHEVFGATHALMKLAKPENVRVLQARCYVCEKPADYTKKIVHTPGEDQVDPGGAEKYQPACKAHFMDNVKDL